MESSQISKEQMRRALAMSLCVVQKDGAGFDSLRPETSEGWEGVAMSAITALAIVASSANGPETTKEQAEGLLLVWLGLVQSTE